MTRNHELSRKPRVLPWFLGILLLLLTAGVYLAISFRCGEVGFMPVSEPREGTVASRSFVLITPEMSPGLKALLAQYGAEPTAQHVWESRASLASNQIQWLADEVSCQISHSNVAHLFVVDNYNMSRHRISRDQCGKPSRHRSSPTYMLALLRAPGKISESRYALLSRKLVELQASPIEVPDADGHQPYLWEIEMPAASNRYDTVQVAMAQCMNEDDVGILYYAYDQSLGRFQFGMQRTP